jgi:hypothetical protein
VKKCAKRYISVRENTEIVVSGPLPGGPAIKRFNSRETSLDEPCVEG